MRYNENGCGVLTDTSNLNPNNLNLRKGESYNIPVTRRNKETKEGIDCTQPLPWTVKARVMFDGSTVFEAPASWFDASIGVAIIELSKENIALIPRDLGAYLELEYGLPGGSNSVTRVMIERYL